MKILYVPNGGFGDASWSTSWPRIWSEKGHEVDVFLLKYTGNPFHANPFVKNMFIEDKMKAAEKIDVVIKKNSYDIILIPNNANAGVKDVIKVTKDFKNVRLFKGASLSQIISDLEVPPLTKPEWFFTEEESKYIKDSDLNGAILFHPVSSCTYEKSRNIDLNIIIECSKKLENIVVVYGGREFLPIDDLKRMEEAGTRLLWEDYNCFNDESGSVLGKFFALTSQSRASVHAWSGSATFSMGYNKPYVVVAPGYNIRGNPGAPYLDTKVLYKQGMGRAEVYGCLNPSVWCITDQVEIIVEAINHILAGKTGIYDKMWTFKE